MTEVRTFHPVFSGGEITPEMYSRVELPAFQTGLRLCKNMLVLPHGPVTRRPGFEYILKTKSNSTVRLIPFAFNTEQTYVIEMGHRYMRFHTRGATVLGASSSIASITSADPGVVTYLGADPSNGDWGYLQGIAGMTEMNGRYVEVDSVNASAKTFQMKDLFGNLIDTRGYASGTGGSVSLVFEIATPYDGSDLFDINFAQDADVMTLVHPSYPVQELSRVSATSFVLNAAVFAPVIGEPTGVVATVGAGSGSITYEYVVTAVDEENFEESVASAASSVNNNLNTAGNYNSIVWVAPVTGTPIRYNIYRKDRSTGDSLYGYIGQADGLSFDDQNIVPDISITPPVVDTVFNTVGEYPGAVSYFEQRKVFGNTENRPQNYFTTRSGTERNMSRSIPLQDNDSIRGRLVAQQVNEIRHFVPLSELLVFTVGGEWTISSADGGALTPASLRARPQSYEGAAKVPPQVTSSSVLYLQAGGSRVNEIRYSWESSSYTSSDATILASHLVDGYSITQMAYARKPDSLLWAVRSDGVLLSLTYVPEHRIRGWAQHETDGLFKSVAVVQEDSDYATYVVVERMINGQTVQYIERLHDRRFATQEDWFGVDSGLSYEGPVTTTITGFWHLEGETLQVLGDGARLSDAVVTDGVITLSSEAGKVHAGLGYAPVVGLLPLTFSTQAAGQGHTKSPTRARLRLKDTGPFKMGPSEADADPYFYRTTEPLGSPPALMNGEIDMMLDMPWSADGEAYLTQDGPFPFTVVGLSLQVEVGE